MKDPNRPPVRLGQLTLWFAIAYLLLLEMRVWLLRGLPDLAATSWDMGLLQVFSTLVFFTFCLAEYLLLHRLYLRVHWAVLAVAHAVLVSTLILFRSFAEEVVYAAIAGHGNYNPAMSWLLYFQDNLYYILIFCGTGAIVYFVQLSHYNARRQREHQLLHQEAELKFLRSQVNPHFLFNTLNNLYALVNVGSPLALPVLDKLSSLLRYALYQQEAAVPLERELQSVSDLLDLERIRQPAVRVADVRVETIRQHWQLPPLLLLPFVENACKHGDLRSATEPLSISVAETDSELRIRFRNAIRRQTDGRDEVGGIGLTNVRQRLELLYPQRHDLAIAATDDIFTVDLTLRAPAPFLPAKNIAA